MDFWFVAGGEGEVPEGEALADEEAEEAAPAAEDAPAGEELKSVRRLGPPHVSPLFPLQGMVQPALPSGAGPPPLVIEVPHP